MGKTKLLHGPFLQMVDVFIVNYVNINQQRVLTIVATTTNTIRC